MRDLIVLLVHLAACGSPISVRSNHGEQQIMGNTFAELIRHSHVRRGTGLLCRFWPALRQLLIPQSAFSAISRSRDSRGPDQVPAQIKGVCNRLQLGWTMTPAKSPGVRSDGEVRRPVGGEQFVQTGLVEFHAMSARPYLGISAFGIHDNSESNS